MAKVEKQFDAVRMMRLIRDRMSEEIRDMTFEEEQACIRQRLNDEPTDVIADAGLKDSSQAGYAREAGSQS
ncbi:MAG: hypothetical protein F4201_04810 [Nitrospira sp. SB0677_bin_15]|nr:hypothetical protein [Nitrospira sp. SB0661_bin_20]MYG40124.1 hypothetical protein [Nitrospira sp. SB0677_bin_15]MYH01688.1 hypothetical protein [Nitrospira sp. SB0675_bin_23]MYJ21979.1 hypothetical protein [Nitrospira sp. SB0673_bin_12]